MRRFVALFGLADIAFGIFAQAEKYLTDLLNRMEHALKHPVEIILFMFGLANDLTGVHTTCFMLLYGFLAGCMILMHYAIRRDEFRQRYAQAQADNFLSL